MIPAPRLAVGDKITLALINWIAKVSGLASPLTTKGDLFGFATAGVRVAAGTDGQVLTSDSTNTNGVSWQPGSTPTTWLPFFGTGSDGAVNFDGVTTPVAGATLSGSTYTLTRNVYAASIVCTAAITLKPSGFAIFCTGTAAGNGTIVDTSGGNAATSTAGAAGGATAYLAGGTAGAAGQAAATSAGTNGTSTTNTAASGSAGAGGASNGGTHAGGTGGTATAPTAALGGVDSCSFPQLALEQRGATGTLFAGPPSGASGGTNASTPSGAGGGSAGNQLFAARLFAGTWTFTLNGGKGGDSPVNQAGGGGGGSGGVATIVTTQATWASFVTVQANGGLFGVGSGAAPGLSGAAGSNGVTISVVLQ